VWSVLAALHPGAHNPNRLSNYKPYENSLDISGLTFPLAVKDVPKFERQNPPISVNVLCGGDQGGIVPLHVSKERDRPHHVNLFLIKGPEETHHYVWVKNLSRLVAGRTKTHCPAFVCNHCLHAFCNKDTLDPSHTPLPTPPTAGSEIPRPKRMYFRIPQQSGQVSCTFLSGL